MKLSSILAAIFLSFTFAGSTLAALEQPPAKAGDATAKPPHKKHHKHHHHHKGGKAAAKKSTPA